MPMILRALIAATAIAAAADSSNTLFARATPLASPRYRDIDAYSARACDAKLIANVQPRRQRPMQSGAQSVTERFALPLATRPGIEYHIPANPKAKLFSQAFTGFEATVTFAAGRGRLDIVTNPPRPELVAEGVSVAPPLAMPGDYYLFDSTGFILVRPNQRTFSPFVIADHEFNYENLRNAWPSAFGFRPEGSFRIDTLSSQMSGNVARHEPTRIYWILKMGQNPPAFPTSAFGRLGIADAPPGESGIARWIGPTEVLADMAHRGAVVNEQKVELTTVVPLGAPQHDVISFSQKQNIECLRPANVDLTMLVLPSGFRETAWPSFENVRGLPRLTDASVAKWRAVPHGE
ncbi:MAG TPA: hypothetical protein VGM82_24390 [Gemmatimonadaceae bacterium]|jgi:hypothetical protein